MYRPRDVEHTVLHDVIGEHLETLLRGAVETGDGASLPQLVEREVLVLPAVRVFEAGVARFQCDGCGREHLVPFDLHANVRVGAHEAWSGCADISCVRLRAGAPAAAQRRARRARAAALMHRAAAVDVLAARTAAAGCG